MINNRKYVEIDALWYTERQEDLKIRIPLDSANSLACIALEAANYNRFIGCEANAKNCDCLVDAINTELKKVDYFDSLGC